MTEIVVKFRDFLIPYRPCQTGTVAFARVTAWLTRYPFARVSEKMVGTGMSILIEIDEMVPAELRYDGDF